MTFAIFLVGDQYEYRRAWIEDRLRLMASCVTANVASFAVMSNWMKVKPDQRMVKIWNSLEVMRRWLSIYPRKY